MRACLISGPTAARWPMPPQGLHHLAAQLWRPALPRYRSQRPVPPQLCLLAIRRPSRPPLRQPPLWDPWSPWQRIARGADRMNSAFWPLMPQRPLPRSQQVTRPPNTPQWRQPLRWDRWVRAWTLWKARGADHLKAVSSPLLPLLFLWPCDHPKPCKGSIESNVSSTVCGASGARPSGARSPV
jgi:hypothetical protein